VATKKVAVSPSPSQRLEAIGIEAICDYVANGDSLRSWTIANGFVLRTVLNWIESDPERTSHYAHARDERSDVVFDSLDDVSEQAVNAETAIEVAGLRLKADNIKWKLARMNAKKYGDKLAIGGAADLPPIQTAYSMTDEELLAIAASGKKSVAC